MSFFYLSFLLTAILANFHINLIFAQDGVQLNNSDRSLSAWTNGAPMPTPRSEIAGAALNGKIYTVGGFDESGQSTTSIEVYDPITDKWTNAAPLPQPLDHTAAASHNGKLYVIGGGYLSRENLSDKLFIYDPLTNKWTEGANLPAARGAMTANFINGTLYVVGGVDVSGTND
jgi:hypothetical protein